MINSKRIRILSSGCDQQGSIIYWMSRDQRVNDNLALLYAQKIAIENKLPLAVVFCLVPEFSGAAIRQYDFMLKGLRDVEKSLAEKGIPFFLLHGQPEKEIPLFVGKVKAGILITDFDPLKIKRRWIEIVLKNILIAFHEVDAHNIVPCRTASEKQEYAARTIRPKINRLLPEFLTGFPKLNKHPFQLAKNIKPVNWEVAQESLYVNRKVEKINWLDSGEKAAHKVLSHFIKYKLSDYDKSRNDPTIDGQSNLSPYLHFGQISAQRIALEVEQSGISEKKKHAFLEELIIRCELSDNFCFYNQNYDSVEGFPEWAKKTLALHQKDKRNYIYNFRQFENAETHDDLWNAAQMQIVKTGKMHGYMRMYWAKKILEWTRSAEVAMQIAINLNDKYELDGRDPNGYAGIAWSIGGIHDRPWFDRPIFGKIRFMSYNGCKSKFNINKYIENMKKL
jgi:deoxyribodipyrimidine photo-lyase